MMRSMRVCVCSVLSQCSGVPAAGGAWRDSQYIHIHVDLDLSCTLVHVPQSDQSTAYRVPVPVDLGYFM